MDPVLYSSNLECLWHLLCSCWVFLWGKVSASVLLYFYSFCRKLPSIYSEEKDKRNSRWEERKENGCEPFWKQNLQHRTHYRSTAVVISWPCNLWITRMQIAVTIASPWLFLEDKTFLKWFWTFLLPLRHSKVCSRSLELYTLKLVFSHL